jgi:hypothetical protein
MNRREQGPFGVGFWPLKLRSFGPEADLWVTLIAFASKSPQSENGRFGPPALRRAKRAIYRQLLP